MPRSNASNGIASMAETFRLLGDSTRLAMIRALLGGMEKNVGKLADETGHSPANTSKHLKQLTCAGILARRKEGLQVYYRLANPVISRLWRLAALEMKPNGRARH
jgi:DNA-binding transcriptional ArsR family regulator